MSDTAVADVTTPRRGHGWRTVARKEFADHLLSARFVVLIGVLGVAAAASVFTAAGAIRSVASDAGEVPALFLKLFTVTEDPVPFAFVTFVGFLAPLLGIMFGFDAVNGERSQGTLARLLSQPIHRDEVIRGKFAGGLAVIVLLLTALTAFVSGIGIFRLGLVPSASEMGRLVVWVAFAAVYVGFWLALAATCSVAVRRSSTSALICVGIWLVLTLFGTFIFQAVGQAAGGADPVAAVEAEIATSRVSPLTLYSEGSTMLLDPSQRTTGLVTIDQVDRVMTSTLTLRQSLVVVWPQMVGLLAMTAALFAVAFVLFMRQDVRA